jgi:cytochrome c-type biogenesis protein CcmH
MSKLWTIAWLIIALAVPFGNANAVQPDEILDDPALEKRAREISLELRCLVCQNQSIDDSNAPLARDLRLLVRDRLKEGDTDSQVIDFIVARYGEFVLLRPRFAPHTFVLWLTPPLLFLIGVFVMYRFFRRGSHQRSAASTKTLTANEKRELKELLK